MKKAQQVRYELNGVGISLSCLIAHAKAKDAANPPGKDKPPHKLIVFASDAAEHLRSEYKMRVYEVATPQCDNT